jgi:CDP-paratose synthetase
MHKLLFLGGSGFLGRKLIRSLAGQHQSFAITRSPYGIAKIKEASPSVQILTPDEAACIRFDRIFNLVVDYGRGGAPLPQLMQTNVLYPLNIFEEISSDVVINVSTALPQNYSSYALTKRLLEQTLDYAALKTGRRFVNVRLHNMYGPGAEVSEIVGFVASMVLAGQPVEVSECSNSRDFVFADDVVTALKLISSNPERLPKGVPVEIGSGEATRLRELVMMIRELAGSSSEIRFGARPSAEFEPHVLVANTELLRSLGWAPHHSLKEGLEVTIGAMAAQADEPPGQFDVCHSQDA